MTRGAPRRITVEAVRILFEQNKTHDEMLDELKCSRATLLARLAEGGMRRRKRQNGKRKTRHRPHEVLSKTATVPPANNPAVSEGHTLYPSTVVPVLGVQNLLVAGINSAKLGSRIEKGRWKGFPVYSLTLEERATCPASCRHWRSCFGNSMNLAKRIEHGAALEWRLQHEVALLASRHPGGFAVRLHVLGDFYSVQYVELWRSLIKQYPALHVFGFSARWQSSDPIAVALVQTVLSNWDRFAIRFSNAPVDECATVSIEHPGAAPSDAVVCPQQLGKTESCSTCAFCWQSKRRVAFIQH